MKLFKNYTTQRIQWMTSQYITSRSESHSQKAISALIVLKSRIVTGSWDGQIILWGLQKLDFYEVNEFEPNWFDPQNNPGWEFQTPPTSPSETQMTTKLCAKKLLLVKKIGIYILIESKIECMCFDQMRFVIGLSEYPFIKSYDINALKEIKMELNVDQLTAIKCIDLKNSMLVCGTDNGVFISDLETNICKFHEFEESVVFVGFIPGRKEVVIMTAEGHICISLINLKNLKQLIKISSVNGLITGFLIKFDNGWKIVAGYQDGNVRSWKLCINNGKYSYSYLPMLSSLGDRVTCMMVTNNMVIAGSYCGRVSIWDLKSSSLRRTLKTKMPSAIQSISHIDGIIITGHYDGTISTWDFSEQRSALPVKSFKRLRSTKE
jgi:WD40 repeat protein